MTTRHQLPGGQWADLIDPDDLSGADQDAFLDEYDKLIAEVPQPAPRPDPANPAQMAPAAPRTLGREGNRALQDWLWARVITGWSYEQLPLPWQAGYREAVGADGRPVVSARVLNALRKAIQPLQDIVTDSEDDGGEDAPKSAAPGGTGGSPGTSAAGTPSLLPAPPAATSSTP